jgi:hypothetical protein
MTNLSHDDAVRLLGPDLIDDTALRVLLGTAIADAPQIPFTRDVVAAAHADGCMLVYRPAALDDGRALNLATLAQIASGRGDGVVAFAAEDAWFLQDPTVNADVPEEGWALVAKEPWRETVNQVYARGEDALRRRGGDRPWRRRRAPEIVLDSLAYAAARGTRLLANAWDWSSTSSHDGGLLNIGAFKTTGLDVLAYSKAVKHGALGICPTLVGQARS